MPEGFYIYQNIALKANVKLEHLQCLVSDHELSQMSYFTTRTMLLCNDDVWNSSLLGINATTTHCGTSTARFVRAKYE